MTELLHQMRDPAQPLLGGSVGSIPSSFIAPNGHQPAGTKSSGANSASSLAGSSHATHSTPASNLKLTEAVRTAQHDGSPSVSGSGSALGRMSGSKSYNSGLNHSAGTVLPTTATGRGARSAAAMAPPVQPALLDISPNNTQFFEVMYVGKIKVSHKRVPFTFIDDALPKFRAYDAQKIKAAAAASRRVSTHSTGKMMTLLTLLIGCRIPTQAAPMTLQTRRQRAIPANCQLPLLLRRHQQN